MLDRREFLKLSAAAPLLLSGISLAADDSLALQTVRGQLHVNGKTANGALQAGDTLSTGDQDAVVLLGKDAYKIGAHTRIQVERSNDGATGILKILGGSVLAVFNQGNKQLVTPTATIGIRGTGVYIDVSADSTYFCNCFGKTELSPSKGDAQTIEAEHHLAKVITHAETPVISKGTMVDHEDAELRELAQLVGVTLPQGFA